MVRFDTEREGFEPSIPCGMPSFQDGALGHYATSPYYICFSKICVYINLMIAGSVLPT